jgi:hypothetical protein
MVRAKFRVTEKQLNCWTNGATLKLEAQYDETIPEDQRFQDATPSAEMTVLITNPRALEALELGKYFYVDFTPIDV